MTLAATILSDGKAQHHSQHAGFIRTGSTEWGAGSIWPNKQLLQT